MDRTEALSRASILAGHHRELVATSTVEGCDLSDEILRIGERLDSAIREACAEGATLFEVWRATGLPVIYVLEITTD